MSLATPLAASTLLARRTRIDRDSGCAVWTGAWSKDGYGVARFAGRQVLAHRLAAFAAGLRALDDPRPVLPCPHLRYCVNPKHLRLVDTRPGGRATGARNARARLLEAEALRAIELHAEGRAAADIAKQLSVAGGKRITPRMVRDIIAGRTWRHLCKPSPPTE